MSRRLAKTCLKVVAVSFTSLVAPLTVHVMEDGLKADVGTAATPPGLPTSTGVTQTANYGPTADRPGRTVRVVAQGAGATADDALRNAGLAAVREALAAEAGSAAAALRGDAVMASVRQDARGVIRSWRELSSRREWRLAGPRYHCEVAVEVDCAALRERLDGPATVRLGPPTGADDPR